MVLLLVISIVCSVLPLMQSAQQDYLRCDAQGECPDASLLPTTTADDGTSEMNTLMVVGGYPDVYTVEVIDLSGNSLTCPQLRRGPFRYGAVGTYVNGRAIVCAGVNDPSHCYTYDNQTDTWTVVPGSLAYSRFDRGNVLLSDGRWWIAGGYSSGEKDETEIVYPGNGTSEVFTALPRPRDLPALLQWNESTVLFVGGWDSHADLWLFNLDTEEWTEMPNMPWARHSAAAGLATFSDGSRQLVVTGGYGDRTTQAFNLDTNTWRFLPTAKLPDDLYYPVSVQFKNTFILIGGRLKPSISGTGLADTILEFDPVNEAWIEREETLRQGKDIPTAFLIPDDYVQCV